MKFVYRGNVLNYHIKPLADELYKILGEDFIFIMDAPVVEKRDAEHDRGDMTSDCPYALNMAESEVCRMKGQELIENCDVLFTLACYSKQFVERMKQNKITIFYNERIFKPSFLKPYHPKVIANMLWYHKRFQKKRTYMFCASAYLPGDFSVYGAYKNKLYKWGYFIKTDPISWNELKKCKDHNQISIAWIGSLSSENSWKHLEKMIPVAQKIRELNIDAQIHVIGEGDRKSYFEQLVKQNDLAEVMRLYGSVPNDKVREILHEANIFVTTSDYEEGWGAVLNEAMNAGCAIVASHAAGSTPYLIRDNQNGIIYDGVSDYGNLDMVNQVVELCQNKQKRSDLGQTAYQDYMANWTAENAAQSLIAFCEQAMRNTSGIQIRVRDDGPCAMAPAIREGDMYSIIKK